MRMKLETEKEYNRKQFGKVRIPRKQLTSREKKSKRKMAQASQRRNRR
jgi:hypothetical protein